MAGYQYVLPCPVQGTFSKKFGCISGLSAGKHGGQETAVGELQPVVPSSANASWYQADTYWRVLDSVDENDSSSKDIISSLKSCCPPTSRCSSMEIFPWMKDWRLTNDRRTTDLQELGKYNYTKCRTESELSL